MNINLNRNVALMEVKHLQKKALSQKSPERIGQEKQFDKKLKEASDGFEELFVHKMLQVMHDSGFKSDLMKGGSGEEIFRDMLDEQYAKIMTRTRTLGLSSMIYNNVKRNT